MIRAVHGAIRRCAGGRTGLHRAFRQRRATRPFVVLSSQEKIMPTYTSHSRAKELFDSTVDYYQQRSEGRVYNFSSLIFQRRINVVEKYLNSLHPNEVVLDFGMGPAVFARFCEKKNLSYIGIDISPAMVERAKALNIKNSEFMVGDLDSLSNFHKSMDAVLAIGLIDYLEYPERGMELLSECVKPGGYLILSFRNRYSFPRVLRDVAKFPGRLLPGRRGTQSDKAFFSDVHERSFDFNSQLRPKLVQLGFDDFEVDYFNCSPFFFNFPMPRWLWRTWHDMDSLLASRRTRQMCSGGVLMAKRAR
jgi:SAM-dependent methyltransferase